MTGRLISWGLAALLAPTIVVVATASSAPGATCTITGTTGPDTLYGTSGPDVICALAGDDVIKALGGADIVFGGAGNDTLDGGLGADTLNGQTGNDLLRGGLGDDVLQPNLGDDRAFGGDGLDTLSYAEITSSGVNINLVTRRATLIGTDVLADVENARGTRLADTIVGDDAVNVLDGLDGADTVSGGGSNDRLLGGVGNDVLSGGDGHDLLLPGVGSNQVAGGGGQDTVSYSNLAAAVVVDLAQQTASGGGMTDTLTSVQSAVGTNGNDTFWGTDGFEALTGLGGDDVFNPRLGGDRVVGGPGSDRADYWNASAGVFVDLPLNQVETGAAGMITGIEIVGGSAHDDTLVGLLFDGTLIEGLEGDDTIHGYDGDDVFAGGPGDDVLHGGDGNDRLYGEANADSLYGGDDDDSLSGGGGADFVDPGLGNDSATGGADTDRVSYLLSHDATGVTIEVGGVSGDRASVGATSEEDGLDAFEVYEGTNQADVLSDLGTARATAFRAAGGADVIDVADGDTLDSVDAGEGTDSCEVDDVAEHLDGCETVVDTG
ncbi:calcium-binding protein [Nocardioides pelophilus]|uniref:calcium-binding protein n=1 Tax=Nocardioides pelophilus TaxID=2172019 RepID=UPI0015FF6184|nr:calcium-binding protein [Nocardioides pelophilus]